MLIGFLCESSPDEVFASIKTIFSLTDRDAQSVFISDGKSFCILPADTLLKVDGQMVNALRVTSARMRNNKLPWSNEFCWHITAVLIGYLRNLEILIRSAIDNQQTTIVANTVIQILNA